MGRRKLLMQKIENYPALQVTYTKRRDGIVKKANELSVLCDTDVGLLMFSPSGKLTKYSSSRRIEDIFLRFICDEKQDFYQPKVENITTIHEAVDHEKFLYSAIRRVEKLNAKLLQKESASRIPESIELEAASFFDGNEVPVPPNSKKKRRNPSMCEYHHARTNSPTSLNPKNQYLNKEGHWILESGWAME
ncbi:MADS-box domain-containing protein [Citrus sinensis]|nr:MADS-box domain-containing protein [Citrus sinensis]